MLQSFLLLNQFVTITGLIIVVLIRGLTRKLKYEFNGVYKYFLSSL